MNSSDSKDAFTIEHQGDITVIVASPGVEWLDIALVDEAADLLLGSLRSRPGPRVVVDLTLVDRFGSVFLSLMIRCWKLATVRGGRLVLTGVSETARELLQVTSLDMVWPIYASIREAIEALRAA